MITERQIFIFISFTHLQLFTKNHRKGMKLDFFWIGYYIIQQTCLVLRADPWNDFKRGSLDPTQRDWEGSNTFTVFFGNLFIEGSNLKVHNFVVGFNVGGQVLGFFIKISLIKDDSLFLWHSWVHLWLCSRPYARGSWSYHWKS